jgi:DNA helicase II / ATP-dependent DNA helicase PcrA
MKDFIEKMKLLVRWVPMSFFQLLNEQYHIVLNEYQKEAVESIKGPHLLLAVPGSGKTTVIVSRCANMILNYEIPPEKILTITFSKESARDMAGRFENIFGKDLSQRLSFSTIHSFCYSVISEYVKQHNRPFPKILDHGDSLLSKNQILRKIYRDINQEKIREERLEQLSNLIGYVKNSLFNEEEIKECETKFTHFHQIYQDYEKFKVKNRCIDFDDMLTSVWKLFRINSQILDFFREKYHYIHVDESQDTSIVQHEIIHLLAQPNNNLLMVGDEDQSIYGFRGATPKALLEFQKVYPESKVIWMERNYRSSQNIVDGANRFIKRNQQRYNKNMFTKNLVGEAISCPKFTKRHQMYGYLGSVLQKEERLSECAILYRNNFSAIPLVLEFKRRQIPFYIKEPNMSIKDHWLYRDICSFISFALDYRNIDSFSKIYFKSNSFLSKKFLDDIKANLNEDRNVFQAAFTGLNHQKTRKILEEMLKNFDELGEVSPSKAISFIENTLGYGHYVERVLGGNPESYENVSIIMDTLKWMMAQENSLKGFFEGEKEVAQSMEEAAGNQDRNAITLSTLHASKGLEFDKVFMIDLVDGIFPTSKSMEDYEKGNILEMEEEARLFYVGMTRARKFLELITYSQMNDAKVLGSQFVKELKQG